MLRELAARYGLGEVLAFRLAGTGIENANYFLTTAGDDGRQRQHVLTLMLQAANAGSAYEPMMRTLAAAGLPVAEPLPNLEGACVESYAGHSVLLQSCLPGRHTVNPTTRQIESLARFTARMHGTLHNPAVTLPAYPRDAAWLGTEAQTSARELPYADAELMRAAVTQVQSLLARGDTVGLPGGMIHGDLFRDNVLFNERGLTGVLDFHHAATGYWLYDLAVIANDWCTDSSGALDGDRVTSLLRAYHGVRPLRPEEVWLFPVFALYAALAFWLSRLAVVLRPDETPSARSKDPNEFRRIVRAHTAHQFYLDPRLLG